MDLKMTITKMKNLLEGFNRFMMQKKELINLKRSIESMKAE